MDLPPPLPPPLPSSEPPPIPPEPSATTSEASRSETPPPIPPSATAPAAADGIPAAASTPVKKDETGSATAESEMDTDGTFRTLPQPFPLWAFWSITIFVYIILLAGCIVLGILDYSGVFWPAHVVGLNLGVIGVLMIAMYTGASFHKLEENEMAARKFLGNPINNLGPGPHFIPPLLCELKLVPGTTNLLETPAEPSLVWREEGSIPDEKILLGWRPANRITFTGKQYRMGGPKGEYFVDSDDPLERTLTAEVAFVQRWRIRDACRFLTRIGSIENADSQLEDAAVTFGAEKFSPLDFLTFKNSLGSLAVELKDVIEKKIGFRRDLKSAEGVSEWGIHLDSVQIKYALSKKLNTSIQNTSRAAARAKTTVTTAKAQREKDFLEGQGTGARKREDMTGEAAGVEEMMRVTGLTSEQILAARVAREAASGPSTTLLAGARGGATDLLGMAGAGAALLNDMRKPSDRNPDQKPPDKDGGKDRGKDGNRGGKPPQGPQPGNKPGSQSGSNKPGTPTPTSSTT